MKLTEKEQMELVKNLTREEKHYALTYFSSKINTSNTFGIISTIFLGFGLNNILNGNVFGSIIFGLFAGFFCYQCWKESNEIENEVNDYLLKGGKK